MGPARIHALTHKAIRPYGLIIDARSVRDDGKKNAFGVVLKEKARGWRIGYLIARERTIRRLERHQDSLETFEPVKGRTVIALASSRDPDGVKLFFLDKPLVVKKGIWHDIAPLSRVSEMKIFENIEVATDYHELKEPITVP